MNDDSRPVVRVLHPVPDPVRSALEESFLVRWPEGDRDLEPGSWRAYPGRSMAWFPP